MVVFYGMIGEQGILAGEKRGDIVNKVAKIPFSENSRSDLKGSLYTILSLYLAYNQPLYNIGL